MFKVGSHSGSICIQSISDKTSIYVAQFYMKLSPGTVCHITNSSAKYFTQDFCCMSHVGSSNQNSKHFEITH